MNRPTCRKVLDCASPLALLIVRPLPKAPEGWRSPRRCRAKQRFMAPMRILWWGSKLPMNRPIEPQRNEGAQRSQLRVPSFLRGFSDGSWSQCASDRGRFQLPMNSRPKAALKTTALQTLRAAVGRRNLATAFGVRSSSAPLLSGSILQVRQRDSMRGFVLGNSLTFRRGDVEASAAKITSDSESSR